MDLRVWMVRASSFNYLLSILIQAVVLDPEYDPKEAKKQERELRKLEKADDKKTFKGTAKAVALAQKLSPKTQRKKNTIDPNTARLTVHTTMTSKLHMI